MYGRWRESSQLQPSTKDIKQGLFCLPDWSGTLLHLCKSTVEFMTATEFLLVGLRGGTIQSAVCSLFNSKHHQRLNWTVNLKMLHQGYQSDFGHYSCAGRRSPPESSKAWSGDFLWWFIKTSTKFLPNKQESMMRCRRRRHPSSARP